MAQGPKKKMFFSSWLLIASITLAISYPGSSGSLRTALLSFYCFKSSHQNIYERSLLLITQLKTTPTKADYLHLAMATIGSVRTISISLILCKRVKNCFRSPKHHCVCEMIHRGFFHVWMIYFGIETIRSHVLAFSSTPQKKIKFKSPLDHIVQFPRQFTFQSRGK